MKRWIATAVVCCSAAAGHTAAQQRTDSSSITGTTVALRVLDAVAVPAGTAPIRIDGDVSEPIWQTAPAVAEFLQREPAEGAIATHATDVRVVYDRDALYVAVHAIDPEPHRIVGLLTRRDDISPSDWISILVDSFNDKRTAYEFGVNAAGVKFDRYWYNDTNSDQGWDAVWDAASSRTKDGWQAEFRVGFSQLRFRAGDTASIGFAAMRTVAHLNETSTWPLLARTASGFVSSFGKLRGLVVGDTQKKIELVPYVLGQTTTRPVAPDHPFVSSPSIATGFDLKYQVAPGLTLTGTVNPDFGQVEADPAVVNLGAFETFFAERRSFFVEGSGNFSMRSLFYSRRIGRAPQRQAPAPDGGFTDQPSNTTILGAAKLTGRVGAFSIGALQALTAPEHARLAGPGGVDRAHTPVEPAASYSVVRLSREFADQSRVTVIGTNTSRRLSDELAFLPASAVTGGVEGDLRFGASRYSLQGFWTGSYVRGAAEAIGRLQRNTVHSFQRPDATHLDYDPLRTSLGGHSGGMSLGKISGERVVFSANAGFRSPGYDVNDLGFQSRADELWQENWLQIRDETQGTYFRTVRVNFNQWSWWNFGGARRSLGYNVNAHLRTVGSWGFGGGGSINRDGFDDRLTRGGPGGRVPANTNGWAYIETDNRKPISVYFEQNMMSDRQGTHESGQIIRTTIRPGASLSVGVDVEMNNRRTARQWVANLETADGVHYVFGAVDRTTVGVGTRVNYAVTPTLSVQLYARPFISSGDYDQFGELTAPLADRLSDRYTPLDYTGNPDFNVRSFRTTNVLRWEYRPGSALFVVWQQAREGSAARGDFALARDLGRMFQAPAQNTLLVKISRWLNF